MSAFELLPPEHRQVVREALTDRQEEVFALLCAGYSARGVAVKLARNRTTVREHIDAGIRRLERCPAETRAALRAVGIPITEPLPCESRDAEADPLDPPAPTIDRGAS